MAGTTSFNSTTHTSGASAVASLSKAFSISAPAGKLIIVTAACDPTAAVFNAGAVTDNQGNFYTRRGGVDGVDNGGIWTAIQGSTGTVTVTVTPSAPAKVQMAMWQRNFVGTPAFYEGIDTQTSGNALSGDVTLVEECSFFTCTFATTAAKFTGWSTASPWNSTITDGTNVSWASSISNLQITKQTYQQTWTGTRAGGCNTTGLILGVADNYGAAAPANDDCTSAVVIGTSAYPYFDTKDYRNATAGVGDPVASLRGGWYQWTAPANLTMMADCEGTDMLDNDFVGSVRIGVYTGSCGGAWTQIAVKSESTNTYGSKSRVKWNAVSGTTYYFLVSVDGSTGVASADWTTGFHLFESPAVPANDLCVNATIISSLPYTNTQNTINATVSVDDPTETEYWGDKLRGVWYKYTPAGNETVTFDAVGSDYGMLVSIWNTGTCGSISNEIAYFFHFDNYPDPDEAEVNLIGGTTYWIWVCSTVYDDIGGGNLTLNLTGAAAVSPPNCLAATTVGTLPWNTIVDTSAYGEHAGDPDMTALVGFPYYDTAYFKFTAPATARYVVETSGYTFATVLGVFTGACDALVEVDSAFGDVGFDATMGTVYTIVIGNQSNTGPTSLTVDVRIAAPPTPDIALDLVSAISIRFEWTTGYMLEWERCTGASCTSWASTSGFHITGIGGAPNKWWQSVTSGTTYRWRARVNDSVEGIGAWSAIHEEAIPSGTTGFDPQQGGCVGIESNLQRVSANGHQGPLVLSTGDSLSSRIFNLTCDLMYAYNGADPLASGDTLMDPGFVDGPNTPTPNAWGAKAQVRYAANGTYHSPHFGYNINTIPGTVKWFWFRQAGDDSADRTDRFGNPALFEVKFKLGSQDPISKTRAADGYIEIRQGGVVVWSETDIAFGSTLPWTHVCVAPSTPSLFADWGPGSGMISLYVNNTDTYGVGPSTVIHYPTFEGLTREDLWEVDGGLWTREGSLGGTVDVANGDWPYPGYTVFASPALYEGRLVGNTEFMIMGVPEEAIPFINAGPDQIISLAGFTTLAGTSFDVTNHIWTKISGAGIVTFADDTDPLSDVNFSQPGVYILRLADADNLSFYDEMQVTVGDILGNAVVGTGVNPDVGLGICGASVPIPFVKWRIN